MSAYNTLAITTDAALAKLQNLGIDIDCPEVTAWRAASGRIIEIESEAATLRAGRRDEIMQEAAEGYAAGLVDLAGVARAAYEADADPATACRILALAAQIVGEAAAVAVRKVDWHSRMAEVAAVLAARFPTPPEPPTDWSPSGPWGDQAEANVERWLIEWNRFHDAAAELRRISYLPSMGSLHRDLAYEILNVEVFPTTPRLPTPARYLMAAAKGARFGLWTPQEIEQARREHDAA